MSWGKRHYARFDGENEEEDDGPEDIIRIESGHSGGGSPKSGGASPSNALPRSGIAPGSARVSPTSQPAGSISPQGLAPMTIGASMDEAAAEVVQPPLPLKVDTIEVEASPMKSPVEVVKERKLASNWRTFVNSLTCFIGAAMYTLPQCFQRVGLIGGIVMLSLSAVISLHCMFLLVDCRIYLETAQQKRIKTYGDLGFYTFGVVGAKTVDTFIMLTQFGFCVCYCILVAETMTQMFPELSKNNYIYLMMPLLIRASWLKSLRSLAKVSLVAEVGMFLSLGMVMFYIVHRLIYGAWGSWLADGHLEEAAAAAGAQLGKKSAEVLGYGSESTPIVLFNVMGLTNFFGVSICVFEGVGMVLPVYNSMKNPNKFKHIWGGTMGLVTALYMFFGIFGYVAYRPDIEDIILANLPHIHLTIAVKLCFCLGLYLTYPLMLFPVIEIWEEMAGRAADASDSFRQTLLWNSARSLLVILTGVLAMYIPKLNLFIALIGASGSTMLAFILPTSFKLKLRWNDMTIWERVREATCFLIGVTGGTISTFAAIKDLRDAYIEEALKVAAGGV